MAPVLDLPHHLQPQRRKWRGHGPDVVQSRFERHGARRQRLDAADGLLIRRLDDQRHHDLRPITEHHRDGERHPLRPVVAMHHLLRDLQRQRWHRCAGGWPRPLRPRRISDRIVGPWHDGTCRLHLRRMVDGFERSSSDLRGRSSLLDLGKPHPLRRVEPVCDLHRDLQRQRWIWRSD